ncbi:MAG: AlkZ family DNA glycosylase [Spirochaetaceae bacterium]|nr:MAG: AlkZ family DNA glycosylase [Spirochaetaceae bacterium]
MDLSAEDIVSLRMAAQLLHAPEGNSIQQIVAGLGGIQAQDYDGAKWSIGIRLPGSTDADVEKAIANQQIIRTWAYRGTLHFLAAADVSWILPLLAPLVIATNQRRYGQLRLDKTTFEKSNRLIRRFLEAEERPRTRNEICTLLEKQGISTQGQRAPYLLQRAALAGLICLGPNRGRESTYMSLPRQNESAGFNTTDALTMLAERYFTSHGPATVHDFCWWSGFPASLAWQALGNASFLHSITTGNNKLWTGRDQQGAVAAPCTQSALLLPPFDEYLLGYKDRSAALDPAFAKTVNAGGGMLKPVIIVNGKVVGVWRQNKNKAPRTILVAPFRVLSKDETRAMETIAARYGCFCETSVEIQQGPIQSPIDPVSARRR